MSGKTGLEQNKSNGIAAVNSSPDNRSAMALYIQDSELAALYHAPPILRHAGNRHYYACHKEVFEAPDAVSWARAVTVHPQLSFTIRQFFTAKSTNPAVACLGDLPLNDSPHVIF